MHLCSARCEEALRASCIGRCGAGGSRCNLKCPDSNLKKEDKVADDQPRFADSFQKPSSGSPPGTLALSALNIKHMKIS